MEPSAREQPFNHQPRPGKATVVRASFGGPLLWVAAPPRACPLQLPWLQHACQSTASALALNQQTTMPFSSILKSLVPCARSAVFLFQPMSTMLVRETQPNRSCAEAGVRDYCRELRRNACWLCHKQPWHKEYCFSIYVLAIPSVFVSSPPFRRFGTWPHQQLKTLILTRFLALGNKRAETVPSFLS